MNDFFQLLGASLYYDKPADNPAAEQPEVETDDGGPELTLDELTDQRIHGDDDEPKEDPAPEETDDGEEDDDEPTPEEDEEPTETDDEPSADDPDSDQDDPEQEDTEEAFYDPEKYKEQNKLGREIPHSNRFATKEQAEYAAVHKAEQIKNALDELKEKGTDHGAVPLPAALQGKIDNLDDLTDVQTVVGMSDEELSQFLWESDEFRHRLQERGERFEKKQESRTISQEFKTAQDELFDGLQKIFDSQAEIEALKDNPKFNEKDSGASVLRDQIKKKVDASLAEDVKALEAWMDSDKADDLSKKEFANQLRQKEQAIREKRTRLTDEYGQVVDSFEKVYELHPKVAQAKEPTAQELVATAWNTFSVWQEDMDSISPLLSEEPGAKEELHAFKNTAIKNREKFNNLQTPGDWTRAEKWWHQEFKPQIRANQQKATLNKEKGKKDKTASSSKKKTDDDIPAPTEEGQQKISKPGKGKDIFTRNKNALDKLVQETDNA